VETEEAYERAERQAVSLLDQGFHLGGVIRATRQEMSSMSDKTFVDTNVLIYAHDVDAKPSISWPRAPCANSGIIGPVF